MNTPPIVSPEEWAEARADLLVKEKELTRARDAMAAQRRRMPWMAVEKDYAFEGPNGPATLRDLFDVVSPLAYILVTGLFYVLFKPVNQAVSAVAAVFSTVGCGLGAVECVLRQTPYNILTTSGVDPKLAQTLAFLVAKVGGRFNEVALIFFGCYCVLIGYLVFKSAFLPRAIGVLMMIAGLGWMTFAWPPLGRALIPYVFLSGIGEAALTFWLVAFGPRFKEQA